MTVPVLCLLGFAVWTLLTLLGTIGVYRWSRILTGRGELTSFTPYADHGSDWYRRAMRAHANCIENLPVFAAIVFAAYASGANSQTLDALAIAVLAGRIAQTVVHIALPATNAAAAIRFSFFIVQVFAMLAMTVLVFRHFAG